MRPARIRKLFGHFATVRVGNPKTEAMTFNRLGPILQDCQILLLKRPQADIVDLLKLAARPKCTAKIAFSPSLLHTRRQIAMTEVQDEALPDRWAMSGRTLSSTANPVLCSGDEA